MNTRLQESFDVECSHRSKIVIARTSSPARFTLFSTPGVSTSGSPGPQFVSKSSTTSPIHLSVSWRSLGRPTTLCRPFQRQTTCRSWVHCSLFRIDMHSHADQHDSPGASCCISPTALYRRTALRGHQPVRFRGLGPHPSTSCRPKKPFTAFLLRV